VKKDNRAYMTASHAVPPEGFKVTSSQQWFFTLILPTLKFPETFFSLFNDSLMEFGT